MAEPAVTDADLQAYVDGELGTAERIAVEAHLRDRPEAAARVLEDLRLRDELRLFLNGGREGQRDAPADAPPPGSVALARELARALHRRSWRVRARRALVAAALVACGWFAHEEFDLFVDQVDAAAPVAPAYADEAAEAHAASALKLRGGHAPDPALLELPAPVTGGSVPVPELAPAGLRFLGSDLVPWDGGVALVSLHDAGEGRLVTLFAAEADGFAVEPPRAAQAHGRPTVFWQHGHFAYALNGALPEAELLRLARDAAARLAPWPSLNPWPSSGGNTHG